MRCWRRRCRDNSVLLSNSRICIEFDTARLQSKMGCPLGGTLISATSIKYRLASKNEYTQTARDRTKSRYIITGSIAHSARCRFLIYSEADFVVFRPKGRHVASMGVKFGTEEGIKGPLLHANLTPICATTRV